MLARTCPFLPKPRAEPRGKSKESSPVQIAFDVGAGVLARANRNRRGDVWVSCLPPLASQRNDH
jgi:hypothetical protein